MTQSTDDIEQLLAQWRKGDSAAQEKLFGVVYEELRSIASFLLNRERDDVSLSTGDVVNEAALRILKSGDFSPVDKAHFLALSARVMRHVLIDAGRKRDAEKRRKITVTVTDDELAADVNDLKIPSLETALIRLKVLDPNGAEIVIMRYYGGMTPEEIGLVLGVSESTVKRNWRAARAWLRDAMEQA